MKKILSLLILVSISFLAYADDIPSTGKCVLNSQKSFAICPFERSKYLAGLFKVDLNGNYTLLNRFGRQPSGSIHGPVPGSSCQAGYFTTTKKELIKRYGQLDFSNFESSLLNEQLAVFDCGFSASLCGRSYDLVRFAQLNSISYEPFIESSLEEMPLNISYNPIREINIFGEIDNKLHVRTSEPGKEGNYTLNFKKTIKQAFAFYPHGIRVQTDSIDSSLDLSKFNPIFGYVKVEFLDGTKKYYVFNSDVTFEGSTPKEFFLFQEKYLADSNNLYCRL